MSRDTETKIQSQLEAFLNVQVLDELDLRSSSNSLNGTTSSFDALTTQEVLSDIVNTLESTNQRPSVAHVKILKSAQRNCKIDIVSIDRDLRFLQIKMNQLLSQLKSLNSAKVKKEAEYKLYTALVSPIRLLPSDILVRVFEYCLPERPGPITTEAPLLLCRVCSLWRNVASIASQLWSTLYIDDHRKNSASLNLIPRWFSSAGNRPLAFHYYRRSGGYPPYPQLDVLVPYSNQIQTLSYDGPTLSQLITFLAIPSGRVEQLEILRLKSDLYDHDHVHAIVTAFGSSPRLHKVFLELDSRFFDSSPPLTLPWGQLTNLNITNILWWQDWCQIFSACLCLKTGNFCIELDDGNTPSNITTHRDLSQLKISFFGEGEEVLFDGFQFPALNTFSLSAPDGDSLFSLSEGSRLSSQITGGSLSRLYLGSLVIETGDFLLLLQRMPTLERLAVDLVIDHRHLCQFLTISYNDDDIDDDDDVETIGPVHLPHLTHLALCIRLREPNLDRIFSAQDFSEMVISRRRCNVARLAAVILQISTEDAASFAMGVLGGVEALLSEECIKPPGDTLVLDTRWEAGYFSSFLIEESSHFQFPTL